jgi:hypothetical protein
VQQEGLSKIPLTPLGIEPNLPACSAVPHTILQFNFSQCDISIKKSVVVNIFWYRLGDAHNGGFKMRYGFGHPSLVHGINVLGGILGLFIGHQNMRVISSVPIN